MMPRCYRQAITRGNGGAVIGKRLVRRTNRVAARKHVRVGMRERKYAGLLDRGLRENRRCKGGFHKRNGKKWNELRHGEYPFDCGTSPMWAPRMRKSGGRVAHHRDVRNRAQSVQARGFFLPAVSEQHRSIAVRPSPNCLFRFGRDASAAGRSRRAAMPAADSARSSAVRARAPSSSTARRSGYAPSPEWHWGRRRSRSGYR